MDRYNVKTQRKHHATHFYNVTTQLLQGHDSHLNLRHRKFRKRDCRMVWKTTTNINSACCSKPTILTRSRPTTNMTSTCNRAMARRQHEGHTRTSPLSSSSNYHKTLTSVSLAKCNTIIIQTDPYISGF